jgi:hypothetical protein
MTTNPRPRPGARTGLVLASSALLAAVPGCAGESLSRTDQEVVAPALETFITEAPGIDKFKGYNEVYDIISDSCLKRCGDADNAPTVDSDESALSVSFVSSAADITRSAMFSLDANVEMALYAGNVDLNASIKVASKTNFSRKAVRMLLVAHRWFKVRYNEQVQIDPSIVSPDLLRRSKASSDADFDTRLMQFIGRCGHTYVNQKLQGAYLFALYEFTSTDQSKLDGLEAKLGGAFRSHVGKIGGGVQAAVQTELNQALNNVSWSVNVVARGFKINGGDGDAQGRIALEQNGQGGLDLQRVVGFFDAMQKSVGDDMQAIQGGDDRHPLSVFPLGLSVGYYPLLLRDVPAAEVTQARSRMSDIMSAHDQMMQTYGQLAAGVVAGRDEAKELLAMSVEDQARHQIMKWPGKNWTSSNKLRDNGTGLLDRVAPYETALDPRAGAGPANDLAKRILDCWRWGRSGNLIQCLPDLSKPVEAATSNAAFAAAKAKLQTYNDSDRPTWIWFYWLAPEQVTKRPDASCGRFGGHIPSWDESEAMGIAAWHRLPTGFPGRTSFWLDNLDPACGAGWSYSFRFHNAQQQYAGHVGCAKNPHMEPTMCVRPQGLFPAALPKLYPAGGF